MTEAPDIRPPESAVTGEAKGCSLHSLVRRQFGESHCLNADCMEVMREYPDGYFDLAICDPPYGINAGAVKKYCSKNAKTYAPKPWDGKTPGIEYFDELRRVSKRQIIWGGNYYASKLPDSRGWIFWDKRKQVKNYAAGELAWTSYDRNLEMVTLQHHGFLTADEASSIHPTQKPVPLYEWTLRTYAETGWKLLDTHMGSGSSVIAAIRHGCTIIACEIDPDYFRDAVERIPNELAQGVLLPPNIPGSLNGSCHRRAPQLFLIDGQTRTKWPATYATDGCGDHRPATRPPG